jgi:hypothetical protein
VAVIIWLEDGRDLYAPNVGIRGMYACIAEQISNDFQDLKNWLFDMSKRCAPFLDMDIRGLTETHRKEFWRAAEVAFEVMLKTYNNILERPYAYPAHCLKWLLDLHRSIESGEPPEISKDFDGEMIDLNDLWPDDTVS